MQKKKKMMIDSAALDRLMKTGVPNGLHGPFFGFA